MSNANICERFPCSKTFEKHWYSSCMQFILLLRKQRNRILPILSVFRYEP